MEEAGSGRKVFRLGWFTGLKMQHGSPVPKGRLDHRPIDVTRSEADRRAREGGPGGWRHNLGMLWCPGGSGQWAAGAQQRATASQPTASASPPDPSQDPEILI